MHKRMDRHMRGGWMHRLSPFWESVASMLETPATPAIFATSITPVASVSSFLQICVFFVFVFFSHCPRVMSCSSFFMSCSFESIHLKKPLVDTPKESEASWLLSTCRKCAYRFAKICEKTMKNLQNPGKTKAY